MRREPKCPKVVRKLTKEEARARASLKGEEIVRNFFDNGGKADQRVFVGYHFNGVPQSELVGVLRHVQIGPCEYIKDGKPHILFISIQEDGRSDRTKIRARNLDSIEADLEPTPTATEGPRKPFEVVVIKRRGKTSRKD